MLRNRLFVVGLGLIVLALDVLSKMWAVNALAHRNIPVLGSVVVLSLVHNSGAAFGSFQGGGVFLGLAAIGALAWVVWYAGRVDNRWTLVGLSFICGGALGNLADRVFRGPGWLFGRVVDFIAFPYWPTFNVADSFVVIGVGIVILSLFLQQRRGEENGGARVPAGGPTKSESQPPTADASQDERFSQ